MSDVFVCVFPLVVRERLLDQDDGFFDFDLMIFELKIAVLAFLNFGIINFVVIVVIVVVVFVDDEI